MIESLLFKGCSDMASFPADFYSFHLMGLKPGGQLDHEVVQQILLFHGYSTPNLEEPLPLKFFSDVSSFSVNSSYNFYRTISRKQYTKF